MNTSYPLVEINLSHLKENVKTIIKKCDEKGIKITGVIKGASGLKEVAKCFSDAGCEIIGSSRLEQIEDAKNFGVKSKFMLIRIPMLSEAYDVVRLCDYSLNSELEVIKKLNIEAKKIDKIHNVVIMKDVGDLREGYFDTNEFLDVCKYVENELSNINLAGIGLNVGCYGSVCPTYDKLNELVILKDQVEKLIGRPLEIVSGGATSSLMRVFDGDMPKGINHLRIGEGILLARDLDTIYNYDMHEMYQDTFRLFAEVIELKDKPTHPIGELAVDCFGHKQTYIDKGIRKRALLGMGRVDYYSIDDIFPIDKRVEIVGASSDHTIIDVENMKDDIKLGDILEFSIDYASMVYLTNSKNVHIRFK